MQSFGLRAPIVENLQAILQDYPGGQLLAEALQNAEDAGATAFSLILDHRHHKRTDPMLAGPAFVLLDNGNGFSDREWESLQTLHKSGKRECVLNVPQPHAPMFAESLLTCAPQFAP